MPDWSQETVFILGGGPSLRGFDPEPLRPHRVIGINEAGLSLAPWCDVLMWADRRWLDWNRDRLHLHTGPLKVARHRSAAGVAHVLQLAIGKTMSWRKDRLGGVDCGSSAINLAVHFGCRRIVLLGFDMHDLPLDRWREGNWHSAHREPPLEGQREGRFREAHERMAAEIRLRAPRIEVLNATPGSALTCWPMVALEDVL